MTRAGLKRALLASYHDLAQHHALQMAAALSYYLVLSVFPCLICLSILMRAIPLPDLFDRALDSMSRFLPGETMHLIRSVLVDVLGANPRAWFSFGLIGAVWAASAAFDAMIEALDTAYDVKETRPFWKTRLIAMGLAAIIGVLASGALSLMIVGPRFGEWLARMVGLSQFFVMLWPFLRWGVAIACTVLAVELLYYLAPYVKQRFAATLPGAILAVGCWIGLSYLLGFYVRHIANFNRIYGTLGGFVAFMTWFYWNAFALLTGAELNAELAKESVEGQVPAKSEPEANRLRPAA